MLIAEPETLVARPFRPELGRLKLVSSVLLPSVTESIQIAGFVQTHPGFGYVKKAFITQFINSVSEGAVADTELCAGLFIAERDLAIVDNDPSPLTGSAHFGKLSFRPKDRQYSKRRWASQRSVSL